MLAIAGAVVAAVAYGSSTILQAIGVRRFADAEGLPWLRRLAAGWLFAAGLGLDAVGFVASFAALRSLPLFLVESVLASSVAITALLAVRILHVRLQRTELFALGFVAAGLVLLAVSASEGPGRRVGSTGGWLLLGFALLVALVAVAGLLDPSPARSSAVLAAASGLGFAVTGVVARVIEAADPLWRTVLDPALWALVIGGIVALAAYAVALERGRTTSVAAITFAVETIVPAAIGLIWLGDSLRSGFTPVGGAGFVLTLGGCLALAGRAEVDAADKA